MDGVRPAFSFVRLVRMFGALAVASALLAVAATAASAQSWRYPHFSSANSSTMPIMTAPAGAGSVTVPNIGTFANGAGPVIALDGTLIIGNQQGRLMALSEIGAPVWNVALSGGEAIVASAMIWNDYIYVVGATDANAALYKFDLNGGEIFRAPFPQHRTGGIMTTAPNISAGKIVLPTAYKNPGAPIYETRVLLFKDDGTLAIDHRIDVITPSTTGSFGSASISPGAPDLELPYPMAASNTDTRTGLPVIVVADGFQTLVGYNVLGYGLTELFRYRDTRRMRSYTITPNASFGGFAANSGEGYRIGRFSVPEPLQREEYHYPNQFGITTPTQTPAGVVDVLGDDLQIATGQTATGATVQRIPLAGRSIVPVAVSQNYVYVSSEDAFTTFALGTQLQQASRIDWVGGGLNPPVIGPRGHVYAIASNILFIFPPPRPASPTALVTQPVKTLGMSGNESAPPAPQATQPTAALPPTQLYHPPRTANGNRLFACQELDGDDCGKDDYGDVSLAWCQSQGYAKVTGYDVDSRKAKAETLNGQFCSKSKCRVFDSIGCGM